MGPCMCGDPYCGSCGDPAREAAIDAEMDRVVARIADDYRGSAECSCGRVMLEGDYPNGPVVYLYRACMQCFAEDMPAELEPEFGEAEEAW